MINNVSFNNNIIKNTSFRGNAIVSSLFSSAPSLDLSPMKANLSSVSINTKLNSEEKKKYEFLLNFLKNTQISKNANGLTPNKQLDCLLKNGKLLSKSNDGTTTLDNLYLIATTDRAYNLSKENLISNVLDLLLNPRFITQQFGDVPDSIKEKIIKELPDNHPAKNNPSLLDVNASGTCAAASNEVNLADKYPAEFARWVNCLSSSEKTLYLDTKLSSISKNKLDAITILKLLQANIDSFNFDKVKIKVQTDKYAYARAYIQDKFWNEGERNVADVLVQSAIMQLGSQNTYDSLTDTRAGEFNSNPQGLIEIEKTFVESLIKNKEISSLIYQKIDDDQNLLDYCCSFEKMQKHITDAIDSHNDVIIGYVLTNETSGRTTSSFYNPENDGAFNKVINGHEITIVDYKKDENGKVKFICIDTDDDSPELVEYSADWLLPKLHHAGYPVKIVEKDEEEIMKKAGLTY